MAIVTFVAAIVYNEYLEYVDGSLVLAPIIYIHLPERANTETFNDFLVKLFDEGKIKIGSVKAEYDKAMRQLKENSIQPMSNALKLISK